MANISTAHGDGEFVSDSEISWDRESMKFFAEMFNRRLGDYHYSSEIEVDENNNYFTLFGSGKWSYQYNMQELSSWFIGDGNNGLNTDEENFLQKMRNNKWKLKVNFVDYEGGNWMLYESNGYIEPNTIWSCSPDIIAENDTDEVKKETYTLVYNEESNQDLEITAFSLVDNGFFDWDDSIILKLRAEDPKTSIEELKEIKELCDGSADEYDDYDSQEILDIIYNRDDCPMKWLIERAAKNLEQQEVASSEM